MAGAVLAVPAIGLTMIYAVLRFVNFSVAAHMAVGAFAGYMLNAWAGLPATVAVLGAFLAGGAGEGAGGARRRSRCAARSSREARPGSRAITWRCARCAATARSPSRLRPSR